MDHSNSEIVDEGPSALEILLSNSAAAGVVESEGSFTIDFQAARSKLASFQLPDPSYYLLKLLQSAFWAQAGRVEIDLHRRTAEYRIHGWSPKVEDILKLLSRPELKDEGDPYQALAMGLQSLLAQGATVALQLPGRDQENLLVLSHDVEWRTSSAAWSVFALTIEWPKSATRTLAG